MTTRRIRDAAQAQDAFRQWIAGLNAQLRQATLEAQATAGWLDAQEGESALRNLRTRPDETAIVGRAAVSPLENCASGYEINRVWASQHDQPPTLRPGPVQTLASVPTVLVAP